MRRVIPILKYVFVGMIVALFLGGCSWSKRGPGEEKEDIPATLMKLGTEYFEKGEYARATAAFQKLKDRYPYSEYAAIAELRLADGHYKIREFEDAYAGYDEFERLHPKNENIPYVIFQKGMCNFQQISTVDRDQTFTLKAKEEFERLIRRFPGDPYANRARKNLRSCLISLADYELYVAHYYFKMGEYRSAMNRYTYLIQNYPDMGQYKEALAYIRKCKEKLSQEKPSEEEGRGEKRSLLRKIWPF